MRQSVKEKLQSYFFILLLSVTTGTAYWVWNNNDYTTHRDVHVTFVDRHVTQGCHKASCSTYRVGLFKTDDGVFFERHINVYIFTQMKLGEQFTLNLRPFDIKQTSRDNVIWIFGALIIYGVTFFLWVIVMISAGSTLMNKPKKWR